jgi:hypothetical protein
MVQDIKLVIMVCYLGFALSHSQKGSGGVGKSAITVQVRSMLSL